MTSFFKNPSVKPVMPFQPTNQAEAQNQMAFPNTLQNAIENITVLTTAVSGIEFEGDDRDRIISSLNQLLASCGVGNGYYKKNCPPYAFNINNPFYRLKAVGYNRLSKHKNSEGLVSLMLMVPLSQSSNLQEKQKIIDAINMVLRPKPQMALSFGAQPQQKEIKIYVEIKSMVSHNENTTEVIINVNEYQQGIWSATDLYIALSQPERFNQLKQLIKCEKIVPLMEIGRDELENYLRRPPPGFEEIWSQAIKENPDSSTLVPYPIQGFEQLIERQKKQQSIVDNQQIVLKNLLETLSQIEQKICAAHNNYVVYRHTQRQLSFRLLRILATQTLIQRYGLLIDEKEEKLQARLETLSAHLNAPDRLRSRLMVIFEILRRDGELIKKRAQDRQYSEKILMNNLADIKRCLASRQSLLEELVSSVKSSVETLETIENHREK